MSWQATLAAFSLLMFSFAIGRQSRMSEIQSFGVPIGTGIAAKPTLGLFGLTIEVTARNWPSWIPRVRSSS